jgi:hypothetical protein
MFWTVWSVKRERNRHITGHDFAPENGGEMKNGLELLLALSICQKTYSRIHGDSFPVNPKVCQES